MKRFIGTLCGFAIIVLLASCSCAIRSESWRPVGVAGDRSAVESSAFAVGFRPYGGVLKKHDSILRIVGNAERIDLQSSWCPLPHHLISARASVQAWEKQSDAIRDKFLQETRKRGIHLRNDQL